MITMVQTLKQQIETLKSYDFEKMLGTKNRAQTKDLVLSVLIGTTVGALVTNWFLVPAYSIFYHVTDTTLIILYGLVILVAIGQTYVMLTKQRALRNIAYNEKK